MAREIYVASPLGFSDIGRYFYKSVLLPAVRDAGFEVLDPWDNPAANDLAGAQDITDPVARIRALRRINDRLGDDNGASIARADAVLAVVDGMEIDSGTSSEVGFAAALGKPVVGLRTDFRNAGDNEGAPINLQVLYFIQMNDGDLVTDVDSAIALLTKILS